MVVDIEDTPHVVTGALGIQEDVVVSPGEVLAREVPGRYVFLCGAGARLWQGRSEFHWAWKRPMSDGTPSSVSS